MAVKFILLHILMLLFLITVGNAQNLVQKNDFDEHIYQKDPVTRNWVSNPSINTAICLASGDQMSPEIVSNGLGGAYVVWQDHRATDFDIYSQHIDSRGSIAWTSNGIGISSINGNQTFPSIVSDGFGGAFVAWEDARNDEGDIYAQRIDPSGIVWTAFDDGASISVSPGYQSLPQIVSVGGEGALINWTDNSNDIYAQRIDSVGIVQWLPIGGSAIRIAQGTQTITTLAVSGGSSPIIAWQENRFSTDSDIYAQRIRPTDGEILWGEEGKPVSVVTRAQSNPRIVSDGAGGAIIAWEDRRSGNLDIYAQRIGPDGEPLWAGNGVAVSTAPLDQSFIEIVNVGSGVIIAWEDQRNGNLDIYAQYVDANGNIFGTLNGEPIAVEFGVQSSLKLVRVGDGEAMLAWEDYRMGEADIYAQHLDSEGEVLGPVNGWVISNAPNDQRKPAITSDGAGGAIVVWRDFRNNHFDIYAQRITSAGFLPGVPIAITDSAETEFFSATLQGIVNPNGLTTSVGFEWGETSNYGNFTNATPSGLSADTISNPVTVAIDGLISDTIYHYRIIAWNAIDTTKGIDRTFRTLKVPLPPSVPDLTFPEDSTSGHVTSPTLMWAASGESESYRLQIALSQNFSDTTIICDTMGIVGAQFSIEDLAENANYFWRVNASNLIGTSQWSTVFQFSTIAEVELHTSFLFRSFDSPSDYAVHDYKILGLPGNHDMLVESLFDGNLDEHWVVYWDNGRDGSRADYLEKFDGTNIFRFSIGRAFWAINKGVLDINETVVAASPDTFGQVSVPIHPNWNIITNPFTKIVDWVDVQRLNDISHPIITYNEGWDSLATLLRPFEGYYYYNSEAKPALIIPYPYSQKETVSKAGDQLSDWRVRIAVKSGEIGDKLLFFGVSQEANLGHDKQDFYKPMRVTGPLSSSFERPDWDHENPSFITDIRPPIGQVECWEFEIKAFVGASLELKFLGIENIPGQWEAFLIDESGFRYQDLRKDITYQFTAMNSISRFNVLVGSADSVRQQIDSILPKEYSLGQNYPNPFNDQTIIPISTPDRIQMELSIYDALGKRIITLYSGTLEPGHHGFYWNGRNEDGRHISSGIYFYRVNTDSDFIAVGKMLLIK